MRVAVSACIGVLLAPCVGCSINPLERLEEQAQAREPEQRRTAVAELSRRDDGRARALLIELLTGDLLLLEEAGNALVIQARRWEDRHPRPPKMSGNPWFVPLRDVAKGQHHEWPVRAKAVWCLGEIGSRRAHPYIVEAYAADSTRVAEEVALARDKLGFTDRGCGFELLGPGQTIRSYDPKEREFVDETERGIR